MARQSTYNELQNQISNLQIQAEAMRKTEVASVIKSIQEQMKTYNLSPEDIESKIPKARKARTRKQSQEQNVLQNANQSRNRKTNMDAKFKHPQTGATWSGRGRMPKWISEEVKQGKNKQEFAIN